LEFYFRERSLSQWVLHYASNNPAQTVMALRNFTIYGILCGGFYITILRLRFTKQQQQVTRYWVQLHAKLSVWILSMDTVLMCGNAGKSLKLNAEPIGFSMQILLNNSGAYFVNHAGFVSGGNG
jgi:hypothetical protein